MNEHYPTESNQPTILGFARLQTISKVESVSVREPEQAAYSTRGTPRRELLRDYAELQRILLARNRNIACC